MAQGTKIRVLSNHVINKIAAGEVVDRPASIVKELVENALDAGADQVDVDVVTGGKKLVAVRDNGSGMGRDDALLSVERHATSKIHDVDDIEHIHTLGFRGEALAAIASVSRFRLLTCPAESESGTEVLIGGGTIQDVRDAGCPCGTSIEVRDLFFNVPARRKFLRSHETELGHIRETFMVGALSHPEAGMSLKVDGRELYRLAGRATLPDRIRDLFGSDYLANLRPVQHRAGTVDVHGFAGLPAASRSDRGEQYVFVNGRPTSAAVLGFAIREGYHTLLPSDRHPAVFLFIHVDPGMVDVNVHPTKREVRFRNPGEIRDAVIAGIRDALGTGAAYDRMRPVSSPGSATPLAAAVQLHIENLPAARPFQYPRLPLGDDPRAGDRGAAAPVAPGAPADAGSTPGTAQKSPAPWEWCRVLGQVGGLYVVLETQDGLVLMDPHAAHERVLFDRYMAQVEKGHVAMQSLLMPETVELAAKDAARVRKHLDLFRAMGFGLSEFGGDTFVVDAVPACLADAGVGGLVIEIAATLEEAGSRGRGRWREEAIAQAACKAAVKARDTLRLDEIEKLVIELAQTEMPYTCPHGRPTLILTPYRELNRKFGRE